MLQGALKDVPVWQQLCDYSRQSVYSQPMLAHTQGLEQQLAERQQVITQQRQRLAQLEAQVQEQQGRLHQQQLVLAEQAVQEQ